MFVRGLLSFLSIEQASSGQIYDLKVDANATHMVQWNLFCNACTPS